MSRIVRLSLAAALALGTLAAGTAGALAAAPQHERSGRYVDTFPDDLFLDLCGIETMTTVTEHWTLTTYADGSQRFRASRTFVPADRRLPIEYGSGMSFFDVNGVQTVHGSPIRLQRRAEGILLLDAGLVRFTDDPTIHGPHPSLEADLAQYYCP